MTDVQLGSGGRPTPNTAMATADQITIVGNGTTDFPLSAGSGGTTFLAQFQGFVTHPPAVGQAVSLFNLTPGIGIGVVTLVIGAAFPVCGILVGVRDIVIDGSELSATVDVQTAAIVTLTEDEWEGVTAGEGLLPGSPYYLDPVALGFLTKTKPTTTNLVVAQVGVAITETQLAIYLPVVPVVNP